MAAFVGYCVQANGVYFPWGLTGSVSYADISAAGGPPDQWDALPTAAKLQILLFVGFLEIMSESTYVLEQSGMKHYMKGGKPGAFPSLKGVMPHPVPFDLWDPFGFTKSKSEDVKAKSLLAESKVPGSVPALTGKISPYAGEVMAPFSSSDAG